MKMTKTLVVALALCLSLVSVAEAKGRSGATFKGGFSSQRQKAPSYQAPSYQAAPKPQATRPSFGGFGGNKAANPSQSYQQPSQMGRDLGNSNAQANAQKAWDARNKPQAANAQANAQRPTDSARSGAGWSGGGQATSGQWGQRPSSYNQRRSDFGGGGFWNGVMWFMLGQSLANSSHANTTVVTAPANNVVQPTDGSLDLGPTDGAQVAVNSPAAPAATQADMQPAAEPQTESALVSLLRALLWTILIVAAFWIVRGIMRIRNRLNNRRGNYSLGG